MIAFRRLMTVVLVAGIAAGLLLAMLQIVVVTPMIHEAEQYEQTEAAWEQQRVHEHGWQPADGVERIAYTIAGTVLTGIAFSALLFGSASLLGLEVNLRRGVALGLAGFACCALAPAIGLPPKPPGVTLANLEAAQIWWFATAFATAIGLWAFSRANGSWTWWVVGAACMVLPHLVGVPRTIDSTPVPVDLIRRFAVIVIATQAAFWLLLGVFGSYLYARTFRDTVEV
jgi:cobalt transporter subunit CbtA